MNGEELPDRIFIRNIGKHRAMWESSRLHPEFVEYTRSDNNSAWNGRAIPAGMKYWSGGDRAPEDWNGGDVVYRNDPDPWTPGFGVNDAAWGADIIAYTPKAAAPVATERLVAFIRQRADEAVEGMDPDANDGDPLWTVHAHMHGLANDIESLAEPAPVGDGRAVGGEHAGRLVAVGDRKHDQYVCSCGWKSETWQDGHEWAEAAWLKHFADAQAAEKYKSRVFERRTQIDGGDQ